MKELDFLPLAAFRLDDDTPFQDYAGYSLTGTRTGTQIKSLALTSTATYGQILGPSAYAQFDVAVGQQGYENRAYTITATAYCETEIKTLWQQIVSHSGDTDGLAFKNERISFSTQYTGGVYASAEVEIGKRHKVNLAGVHTATKNQLYVDGVMVAEATITPEMTAAGYANSGTTWRSGSIASADRLAANNICFFPKALTPQQIKAIHDYNNRVAKETPANSLGGKDFVFERRVRKPFMTHLWDTNEDWNAGQHAGTSAENGQLVPTIDEDGLTVESHWFNSYAFADPSDDDVTLHSAHLWWDGQYATIEISVDDGVNWITVDRYQNIAELAGFSQPHFTVMVHVLFDEGLDVDLLDPHLDSLVFDVWTTGTGGTLYERPITYSAEVTMFGDYEENLLHDDWGVALNGGRITFGTDPSEAPIVPRTIEFWIKLDNPTDITFSSSISTVNTSFVNGVSAGSTVNGQWAVYHYTFTSGITAAFWIEGEATIGKIVVYPTELNQTQVTASLANQLGVPKLTIDASATINLTEPSLSTDTFQYDWLKLTPR